MEILRANNISASYDKNIVLKNVSFSLSPGELLSVIGENGSGKSTLIKCILGLKDTVLGDILYADDLKPCEIGYLPQNPEIDSSFPASVWEIVLSGTIAGSKSLFYTKEQKETAKKAMSFFDIENLKKSCFGELSGGQQQRVLLARAICSAEKLLILDEPVASLDPIATAEFYTCIKKLIKKKKIAVIMVSHNISDTVSVSDKVLHLGEKSNFFGTTEEYRNSTLGKRFLGGEDNA